LTPDLQHVQPFGRRIDCCNTFFRAWSARLGLAVQRGGVASINLACTGS
jgi:hypothetical protein